MYVVTQQVASFVLQIVIERAYQAGKCEVHTISFQTFFVWAFLLIVHT